MDTKVIGLLGGMSWESTATYYRLINEGVKDALGNLHSARIVLYSVDFAPIERLQQAEDWDGTARILTEAALSIQKAGADCLLICTNTMHKVAPQIESRITIPLLHIADAAGEELSRRRLTRVGLLGTRFTMEQDFYRGRLAERFGLEVLIPELPDREILHRVIYQELCTGKTLEVSRREFLRIIDTLHKAGAEAVILGCTEIGLLVKSTDTNLPLLDTTVLHADAAVGFALGK
ncbi:MAG: aspartate/glutamate racemase family protein, partial [Pseudohongiellaceae bacterium]